MMVLNVQVGFAVLGARTVIDTVCTVIQVVKLPIYHKEKTIQRLTPVKNG